MFTRQGVLHASGFRLQCQEMCFSASRKDKTTEVSVEMPQFARINGSICHPFLILFKSFLSSDLDGGAAFPPAMLESICILLQCVSCCEDVARGDTAHSMLE